MTLVISKGHGKKTFSPNFSIKYVNCTTNLDEQFTIHALASKFQRIQESKIVGFPLIADQATKAPMRTQPKKVSNPTRIPKEEQKPTQRRHSLDRAGPKGWAFPEKYNVSASPEPITRRRIQQLGLFRKRAVGHRGK